MSCINNSSIRNSSIELLRIICILSILTMHTYGNLPYNKLSEDNKLLIYPIEIGNFAVSTFILISGYFGIRLKGYRFVQLILLTTLYSIIVYFLNNGFNFNLGFIKACLIIPLYNNWFITCYLFLMILAQYIDILLNNLSKRQVLHFLIIFFVGFSLLPTVFNTPYHTVLYGGGKCLAYMIYIYMIGRYIKLYSDICISQKISLAIFLLSALILCLLNVIVGNILEKKCLIYSLDCSPFILLSSIAIFFFFKSMNFYSKLINYIASSVLAVYLLGGIRFFIDKYLINLNLYLIDEKLVFMLILEVLLTFLVALIVDKFRLLLFDKVEKKIINKVLSIKCFVLQKYKSLL